MSEKKTILVALDIEKAGCQLMTHPIISIGWCIGDTDGTVLDKSSLNIQTDWPITNESGKVIQYGAFEPRCWDEFWSKQSPELIRELKRDTIPQPVALQYFSSFLDSLENKYPENTHKIKFLSDNAAFDIATLDYNLEIYAGRRPLCYSKTGKYREVEALDNMLDMLPSEIVNVEKVKINDLVKHDHHPANDAEVIYREWLLARKLKKIMETKLDAMKGIIFEIIIPVCVIGDPGVGKTALIKRLSSGDFNSNLNDRESVVVTYNTNKGEASLFLTEVNSLSDMPRETRVAWVLINHQNPLYNLNSYKRLVDKLQQRCVFTIVCETKSDNLSNLETKTGQEEYSKSNETYNRLCLATKYPYFQISAKSNYNLDKPILKTIRYILGEETSLTSYPTP